eukprot:4886803-Amphidinium_carterae.1
MTQQHPFPLDGLLHTPTGTAAAQSACTPHESCDSPARSNRQCSSQCPPIRAGSLQSMTTTQRSASLYSSLLHHLVRGKLTCVLQLGVDWHILVCNNNASYIHGVPPEL